MVIQSLMFADDTVLLATTKAGLQRQIDQFANGLARFGMSLNAKKSATLSILRTVKNRSPLMYVDASPSFKYSGETFPALDSTGTYKYLGIKIGYEGTDVSHWRSDLDAKLERLSRSALNPQEKLFALREIVIPGMIHGLVLSETTMGFLRKLDKVIRVAIRAWVHLPDDTPLGFFHARAIDGGLGVPSLSARIPRLRRDRFCWDADEVPAVMAEILKASALAKWRVDATRIWLWPQKPIKGTRSVPITCKADEYEAARSALHQSVDGRGLKFMGVSHAQNESRWVTHPTEFKMAGSEFVKSVLVRGNLLKTGERATRGADRGGERNCRRCGTVQSLGHISNHCPWSQLPRVERHNRLVKSLREALEKRGWKTQLEPRIKLDAGSFCKPDLVIVKDNETIVLDPSIVGSSRSFMSAYHEKIALYDKPEVRRHAFNFARGCGLSPESFQVFGVIVNYRGAWAPMSWAVLKMLKIPPRLMIFWTIRVLVETFAIFAAETRQRAG